MRRTLTGPSTPNCIGRSKPPLWANYEVLERWFVDAGQGSTTKGGWSHDHSSLLAPLGNWLPRSAPRPLATDAAKPIRVTSSLDGKKVLPLRTRWLARANIPPPKIKEVDFLIDGKLRWIEHYRPYNYGSDDPHGHLGFLITTWLRPGHAPIHRPSSSVRGSSGHHIVAARVFRPRHRPPRWRERGPGTSPLKTSRRRRRERAPLPACGGSSSIRRRLGARSPGIGSNRAVRGNLRRHQGVRAIQMAPFSDGRGGVTRFGHHGIGGTVCSYDGPFGSWTWSVSADQLTLTSVKDPCGDRRAIWEGTWTHVQ